MAQITLNMKLTSESFSLNDDEIVFIDTNYVDGVASGAIITVIDSASADTYQKVVEESPSAVAALSTNFIQITLTNKQTPYIAISRIVDIITNGSYSYIMYNDNGNTNKRIDTLLTTAQILTLINTEQNEPLVYIGLLSQSGTAAPTANIQKNTLGYTPSLSYLAQGNYRLTLNTALSSISKANIIIGQDNQGAIGINYAYVDENDLTEVIIQSKEPDGNTGENDKLYYTSFRLEIYP